MLKKHKYPGLDTFAFSWVLFHSGSVHIQDTGGVGGGGKQRLQPQSKLTLGCLELKVLAGRSLEF